MAPWRDSFTNRRAQGAWPWIRATVARLDPNTDPDAEPLRILPLLVVLAATGFAVWMYLRWKYQPMQDLGHHVALAAVVADYGRPGSLYTPLYEPIDPIAANSLLYQLAGRLGRIIGVTTAVRVCMTFYVAGVPLANLYALRVFGRSPWAAVLVVPLVFYNMNFIAGFANLLFAAPLMLLILPVFYRTLETPTWRRTLASSVLFVLLFLGHAHLFLWTGALSFLMAFAFLLHAFAQAFALRGPAPMELLGRVGKLVLVSVAAVAPSLLMFAHWYSRTFGAGRAVGGVTGSTSGWSDHFGAYYRPIQDQFTGAIFSFRTLQAPEDVEGLVCLIALTAVAVALARFHRFKKPPVLELAFAITGLSYFLLPDGLKGHDVLSQRQPGIALWLLPALVTPVPARASRTARTIVIVLILGFSATMLRTWYKTLASFEAGEVAGLASVMEAAPPRLRLHYVKSDPHSQFFAWRPFWHIEKIYMGDALGQAADTPGILSTSCIRYRAGAEIHRIDVHYGWENNMEMWQNYELILLRRWNPTPALRATVEQHATLLRAEGDWQLWRSKEATTPPSRTE